MEKSRLIEVLQTFSKKDVRDCRKFLHSPIHNQRKDVVGLFEYLAPLIPFRKKDRIKKAEVFRHIFPKATYEEKKISYTISFLYNQVKSYLAYQEFAQNRVGRQVHLSRALRNRGLNRHFESEIKLAREELNKQPYRSTDYHFNDFQIQFEICDYLASLKQEGGEELQGLFDSLNTYFVAQKLNLSCAVLSQEAVSKLNYQKTLLPEVLEYVQQQEASNLPAVAVYYNSYKMLTEQESEPYFYQLKQFINDQHHRFPLRELKDIYLFTINYCIKQQNQGKKEFLSEAFNLYKKGLEQQVFIEHGKLSRMTYNNIALAGLILTEYDWVETFLYAYRNQVEEKQEGMSYNYNLAYLYYKKNDYAQAMQLLQQVEFEDMLLNLQSRRMLLKIYYELGEFNALDSLLSSFKNYIYRQDLGYHRDNYLNLIKYTKKLLQLSTYGRTAAQQLYTEIETSPALAERRWLLNQVEQQVR